MKDTEFEQLINTEEFEYAIQILRWLFQPLGIWPIKSMGYSSFLRLISIMTTIWSAVFLIIPGILSIIRVQNDFMVRFYSYKNIIAYRNIFKINILSYNFF